MTDNNTTTLANEKTVENVLSQVWSIFVDQDLDFADVQDNYEQSDTDAEKIGVLLRWIDSQSFDDEWKEEISPSVLKKYM